MTGRAVLTDAKEFALGFVQIPRTLARWTRQIIAALRFRFNRFNI